MFLLLSLIGFLLQALKILLFVRVILSFVPHLERTPWGKVVFVLTEPLLKPLRSFTRVGGSGMALDFSPMVALLIIAGIQSLFRL